MKVDITDMERMVDAYLDFARGEGHEQASVVNLKDLLHRCAEKATRQGATLDMDVAEMSMPVKALAFERCIDNLIGNACQYGGHIWIKGHRDEEFVEISIEDNGPGIDETQYEDVFRPFFRLDSSRNLSKGGVGLGLPIAQDIVHSHGGEIVLEKSGHGGLAVRINLPL